MTTVKFEKTRKTVEHGCGPPRETTLFEVVDVEVCCDAFERAWEVNRHRAAEHHEKVFTFHEGAVVLQPSWSYPDGGLGTERWPIEYCPFCGFEIRLLQVDGGDDG